MSKRNYQTAFLTSEVKVATERRRQQVKKHTLDSDEEDDVEEDNVLDADDIEGEEEGIARQDGEQKMTAFNMNEELEEGHFDKQGHFIWNNEKEIRDNWLDNIDWQKIQNSSDSKDKYNIDERGLGDDSESESEVDDDFDEIATYKQMLEYLKPKESVNKALKRLAGDDIKLSSVERLRRKKAGTLNTNQDVIKLTELANQILTKLGNMDVYQETYEQIKAKIDSREKKNKSIKKEPELDMYSDDFDTKEKDKIQADISENSSHTDTTVKKEDTGSKELMWEFKWNINDDEIHGPYSNGLMIKWAKEDYFKEGVMVRKCGENSNFYTSTRIDFELYE